MFLTRPTKSVSMRNANPSDYATPELLFSTFPRDKSTDTAAANRCRASTCKTAIWSLLAARLRRESSRRTMPAFATAWSNPANAAENEALLICAPRGMPAKVDLLQVSRFQFRCLYFLETGRWTIHTKETQAATIWSLGANQDRWNFTATDIGKACVSTSRC